MNSLNMIEVRESVCPKCGAKELHKNGMLQIRGMKFFTGKSWESQCLVCSGGYDKINGVFTQKNHDPKKGWFREEA